MSFPSGFTKLLIHPPHCHQSAHSKRKSEQALSWLEFCNGATWNHIWLWVKSQFPTMAFKVLFLFVCLTTSTPYFKASFPPTPNFCLLLPQAYFHHSIFMAFYNHAYTPLSSRRFLDPKEQLLNFTWYPEPIGQLLFNIHFLNK